MYVQVEGRQWPYATLISPASSGLDDQAQQAQHTAWRRESALLPVTQRGYRCSKGKSSTTKTLLHARHKEIFSQYVRQYLTIYVK